MLQLLQAYYNVISQILIKMSIPGKGQLFPGREEGTSDFWKIALHSWQKYRKTGSKFANTPGNTVAAGWSLFIKGAGESQRSSPAFTGKCRLVRRRGERAAENAGNTQIRLKYEYEYTKYTQKDKKYTNTKIQTLMMNTSFTIGSLSQIRRGKKEIFWKKCSHENGRNFGSRIISKGPRVPKQSYSTGLSTPKQDWVSQKSFYGGKVVRSFKKLGEDRICSSSSRSPLDSIQI